MTDREMQELRHHVDVLEEQVAQLVRGHSPVVQENALANSLCDLWFTEHAGSLDGLAVWFADHVAGIAEGLRDGRIQQRRIQ